MMNFNPHVRKAQQAQSNGGAIAALTKQGADSLVGLGAATSKAGQDIRGQNLSALLAGKEAQAMNSTQLQALAMAEAGGSINPELNKDIQAMIGAKATEEAAILKNENALATLGIEINADMARQDSVNTTSTENSKRTARTSRSNNIRTTEAQKALQILKDKGSLERKMAMPYASAGGNLIYDQRTGQLSTLLKDGTNGGLSLNFGLGAKASAKNLMGNKLAMYKVSSKAQMQDILFLDANDKHFNVQLNKDNKGKVIPGSFYILDGNGKPSNLANAVKEVKAVMKFTADKKKREAMEANDTKSEAEKELLPQWKGVNVIDYLRKKEPTPVRG